MRQWGVLEIHNRADAAEMSDSRTGCEVTQRQPTPRLGPLRPVHVCCVHGPPFVGWPPFQEFDR